MKKNLLYYVVMLACSVMCATSVNAQVAAYPYTASLDTFNIISGTTLDAPGVDDVTYPNLNIGFNFNYGGVSHSSFSASTNGYIQLDTNAGSFLYNPLSGGVNNVISPFGADLRNMSGGSLQYVTLGNAPNRVLVVQWLHYSYYPNSGDLNFQIWLYENSGGIRFVYGANTYISSAAQIQIGLRGTTNMDYQALGDTTCNWANAYPFPSIATHFPISLSCTQPSGFAFHFGNVANNGNLNFAYITGKVFNDANNNGTLDAGETGLPNHIIHLLPSNYYVSSDAIGNYAFYFSDSTITYSLNCSGQTYWNQSTAATLMVNPLSQSTYGNDFGFHMIPNVHEVAVTCPNWGARPGQQEPMPIHYQNNGTVTESDTISFVMDALYSFVSSVPAPVSVSGQTIKWVYSNLGIGQSGYINLQLMPDTTAILGNYLNSTLTINPVADTVPANNVIALHQLISNAWDPNEKSVSPAGMIPNNTELKYTIHFQNTGNAPAANISVKDTLDTNVDPMTFVITGSSHPYNFVMNGNGVAIFNFYNIQLPDSSADFAGSNGWISYSITTKPALPELTVINNRASIYFDYNQPVLTNTTADTIQMLTTSITDGKDVATYTIKAYPNPASNNVVFVFSDKATERANLVINSIEGKQVMSRSNITSTETVDVGMLPAGVYMCTITGNNAVHYAKLIKE